MPRLLTIDTSALVALCLLAVPCLGAPPDKPAPPDQPVPQIETVPIRGATFTMGTPLEKGAPGYYADEAPVRVRVKSFRIGKFPVTAAEMCAFLNSEQARRYDRRTLYNHEDIRECQSSTITVTDDGKYVPRKNAERSPASQVPWKGAVLFCRWLSEQTGKEYRLPSEAEWELGAGGAEKRPWPWGDADPGPQHGERYSGLTGLSWSTVAVGSHPANATPEGVHDLLACYSGEWCANKYRKNLTRIQATDTRADLNDLNSRRVVRGGSRRYYRRRGFLIRLSPYSWRISRGQPWTRIGHDPIKAPYRSAAYGFRVVEVVDTPPQEEVSDEKLVNGSRLHSPVGNEEPFVRTHDFAIVIVCLALALALGLYLARRRKST